MMGAPAKKISIEARATEKDSTSPILSLGRDGKIAALDGLRGAAALMVVFYHCGPHAIPTGIFSNLHFIPQVFFAGVDLFFVLSGFLIGGILMDVKESPRFYSTFYLRRTCRILPLYYLVVSSYIVARYFGLQDEFPGSKLFTNPIPVSFYFFHLQNFAMLSFDSWGPIWLAASWSLAVEEQFYLLLPLLVRRVSARALFKWSVVCFLGSIGLRAFAAKTQIFSPFFSHVMLFTSLDGLSLGVIIAYLVRYRSELLLKYKELFPRLTLAVAVSWAVFSLLKFDWVYRFSIIHHTSNAVTYALLTICLLLYPQSRFATLLSHPVSRYFGKISFGVYLLHPIIGHSVFQVFKRQDISLNDGTDVKLIILGVLITLVFASVIQKVVEEPFLRLGKRFKY